MTRFSIRFYATDAQCILTSNNNQIHLLHCYSNLMNKVGHFLHDNQQSLLYGIRNSIETDWKGQITLNLKIYIEKKKIKLLYMSDLVDSIQRSCHDK